MGREVLIVGSVPLSTAEDVFSVIAHTLGDRVARIPDGETGERLKWIRWQAEIFDNHPMLSRAQEHVDGDGKSFFLFHEIKPGIAHEDLSFGSLGYASAAIDSYGAFAELKRRGEIHAACRFQVSLPSPYDVIDRHIAPAQCVAVEHVYASRMLAEIDEMCAAIPLNELAIQWDVAREICVLEVGEPFWPEDNPRDRMFARLAHLGNHIPSEVELGFHLCYGDYQHKHNVEPRDTGLMVDVANQLSLRIERPIEWIHMPVPRDRNDEAYFSPLSRLTLRPETTLYLGLIHLTDGLKGSRRRMKAAEKFVGQFGVATECGFGRRPPETVPPLMKLHADVADIDVP